MSFVSLEHQFGRHPKVSSLTDSEFRAWVLLLLWCAEYRTRGRIDNVGTSVPGVTRKRLERFVGLGLVDVQADGLGTVQLFVHDYDEFNGTARDRELAKQRKREERARERAARAA